MRDDVKPVCPYCEEEIDRVCMQEAMGVLGKRYIYFCPNCRKILGMSHRKGFWMG